LLEQHIAEADIGLIDAHGEHQFFDVVIHGGQPFPWNSKFNSAILRQFLITSAGDAGIGREQPGAAFSLQILDFRASQSEHQHNAARRLLVTRAFILHSACLRLASEKARNLPSEKA
jgi:hypothetical protein